MLKREVAVLLAMVLLVAAVAVLITRISNSQGGAETEFVQNAVKNAAITCYAVEGAYPDDLSYLRENYGLAYNENRYLVTYNAFASNQLPEIYVMEKGATLP
ncbi:MAG: hypothetical protein IJ719_02290 [Clostridia bacterium]|nr:hypothetical protein [Clostridia bacterium]